jgi:hypothetical protein
MIAGASASFAPLQRGPRSISGIPHGLTGRYVLTTLVVGIGLFLYSAITRLGGDHHGLGRAPEVWPLLLLYAQCTALALMSCVVVADYVTRNGPMRRGPYVLAVIAGTLAGTAAQALVMLLVRGIVRPPAFSAYLALELLMLAGGFMFIHYDRRRAQSALGRLHAAELERVAASKRMLGSRLQAMQARAEPQFLLNTLSQVKALYERDQGRGERVLDALIAYLRAAMPSMRDTTSTVGRECDLVRAFLDIARVRLEDRLDFMIEIHDTAGEAKLPPMILIPLVERLVQQPLPPRRHLSIRVEVMRIQRELRLSITSTQSSLAAACEVTGSIRERLAALYGEKANLLVRHASGQRTEAVLTVPHEPAMAAGSDDRLQPHG